MTLLQYFGNSSFHYQALTLKLQKEIKLRKSINIYELYLYCNEIRSVVIMYDQINGVSIGSPLGSLFANIFMDEFENNHMAKLNELGLKTWNRYLDDVFSLIDNEKTK